MRVAIHQPNFFPWMGYFNKMAKSDLFILLDTVQLSDSGTGQRNRILNKNGEVSFLTVAFDKKNYFHKNISDVKLNLNIDWQKRQYNFLWDTYHRFPTWDEVYQAISPIYENNYSFLYEVNKEAIDIVCEMLQISTKIVKASELDYDRSLHKSDLVLELCKSVNADIYLSGNGARKYMNVHDFHKNEIQVQYQIFQHPFYQQKYAKDNVVLGLSILDVLFNCGIEETKRLFWNNLQEKEKNEPDI